MRETRLNVMNIKRFGQHGPQNEIRTSRDFFFFIFDKTCDNGQRRTVSGTFDGPINRNDALHYRFVGGGGRGCQNIRVSYLNRK